MRYETEETLSDMNTNEIADLSKSENPSRRQSSSRLLATVLSNPSSANSQSKSKIPTAVTPLNLAGTSPVTSQIYDANDSLDEAINASAVPVGSAIRAARNKK